VLQFFLVTFAAYFPLLSFTQRHCKPLNKNVWICITIVCESLSLVPAIQIRPIRSITSYKHFASQTPASRACISIGWNSIQESRSSTYCDTDRREHKRHGLVVSHTLAYIWYNAIKNINRSKSLLKTPLQTTRNSKKFNMCSESKISGLREIQSKRASSSNFANHFKIWQSYRHLVSEFLRHSVYSYSSSRSILSCVPVVMNCRAVVNVIIFTIIISTVRSTSHIRKKSIFVQSLLQTAVTTSPQPPSRLNFRH